MDAEELPPLPRIRYREHVTGERRTKLVEALAAHYRHGTSIAGLATETGMSVSSVNRLLDEGEVQRRPRGGARSPERRSTGWALTGQRRRG